MKYAKCRSSCALFCAFKWIQWCLCGLDMLRSPLSDGAIDIQTTKLWILKVCRQIQMLSYFAQTTWEFHLPYLWSETMFLLQFIACVWHTRNQDKNVCEEDTKALCMTKHNCIFTTLRFQKIWELSLCNTLPSLHLSYLHMKNQI